MHLILCERHMVWRRNTSATGVIQKRRKGCRWLPGYLGSAGLVLNTIVISALKTFLQGWNVGEEKVKPVEPAWHATKGITNWACVNPMQLYSSAVAANMCVSVLLQCLA